MAIFKILAPNVDSKRVCIKIPATWEGLQACRILEADGFPTLATTMFCMEQAALAAAVDCTYIAPYVNELKVHFEQGYCLLVPPFFRHFPRENRHVNNLFRYVDQNKAFDFCRQAQAYFAKHASRTQVLAASLTSVDEVMQLAGIHHITISPTLLDELAGRRGSSWNGQVGAYFADVPADNKWDAVDYKSIISDQSTWRLAFTRSGFGTSEGKIIQAINYFSDFQEKIEELVLSHQGFI